MEEISKSRNEYRLILNCPKRGYMNGTKEGTNYIFEYIVEYLHKYGKLNSLVVDDLLNSDGPLKITVTEAQNDLIYWVCHQLVYNINME